MQDGTLNCSEARARMASYLTGEPCPEVADHLAACDACLEACLDAALRQAREVRVPEHFRNRVLARLPTARADAAEYPRGLLGGLLAVAGALAALGAGLWWSGELLGITALVIDAMARPAILVGVLGIETALSLLWLWRVATADP